MVYLMRLNFKFRYFPGGVGGGGWVREVENKAKLSPAGAEAWTELGKKNAVNSGHYVLPAMRVISATIETLPLFLID